MNLKDCYKKYAEADKEIEAKKAEQKEIIKEINDNHLEEVHKTSNCVVVLDDQAYTLSPTIDRTFKNETEDKNRKLFELKVQPTTIFKTE